MNYKILSPAQRDLTQALDYYDTAQTGLGLNFLDEAERTIARILTQPEAWARISEKHRRCMMRRFPYGVIYSIEENCLLISAVMHLHRHPASWRNSVS